MTEHENQWTKALAENGTFDADKAKRAGEMAVSKYTSGLKKTERIVWAYLTACAVVAVFSFDHLAFATSNKAMIAFGIAFLVAIETTILLKLWYWIVNTKLTLQKEIREWQLQGAASDSAAYVPTWMAEMSFAKPGVSRWERTAWFVGLVLATVMTSSYVSYSEATAPNPLTLSESIKLSPGGAASSTACISYRPQNRLYVESIPFYTGCADATFRWFDERGRQMPFDVSTEDCQRCFTVYLIEPLGMNEWLRYTQIMERPSAATKEGDLWTYKIDYNYGCSINRYFITVELPRGAKVESVEPQPIEQTVNNETPRLVFGATRGRNERFESKIQYRLAEAGGAVEKSP